MNHEITGEDIRKAIGIFKPKVGPLGIPEGERPTAFRFKPPEHLWYMRNCYRYGYILKEWESLWIINVGGYKKFVDKREWEIVEQP